MGTEIAPLLISEVAKIKMDRRRLLCIEVVLLAAVVACTGSEGPSAEELSTTQLVELAETGPNKGLTDVVGPIMAVAKAKVHALDVQETQEKLAEAKMTVVKEQTKLAGDKIKLASMQLKVAGSQRKFDEQAEQAQKGNISSAVLNRQAKELATSKSNMIKVQSQIDMDNRNIEDASSIVTVDRKTVQRRQKAKASKSYSQLKADVMNEATNAAEVASAAQAANHMKKMAAAKADKDFNRKHTQAIAQAEKALVLADQASQQKIDVAQNEVSSSKDREKRAAAKEKILQVRARAANFGAAIGQRDELVAQQEKKEALIADKDKQAAKEKAKVNKAQGFAAIKEAKEMLEDNKLRIAESAEAVQKAEIDLKDEQEKERLDKKKVAITSAATRTLELQTSKLEKKRDAVYAFGATLKERAERDANAAKAGLVKAKDDLGSAKKLFDLYTRRANDLQGKISKSSGDKKKLVTAILGYVKHSNTQKAIVAGESIDGLQALIDGHTSEKNMWDNKAKGKTAMMDAARKEEKQGMDLQLLANKQMNQARNNDVVLKRQSDAINELYEEQNQRKAKAANILEAADERVGTAQRHLYALRKQHAGQTAANRYLRDVKIAVAQEMVDSTTAMLEDAKAAETRGDSLVSVDASKLKKAAKVADSTKRNAKTAAQAMRLGKKKVEDLRTETKKEELRVQKLKIKATGQKKFEQIKVQELKQNFKAASVARHKELTRQALDAVLKKSAAASEAAKAESVKIGNQVKYMLSTQKNRNSATGSAKTEATAALAGAIDTVKRSNTKHKARLDGLSATQLEVANAKQAYTKAFGTKATIPGQAEDTAIQSAKSTSSKAISDAAGALSANGVN